ncbi:DUF4270 domain-containing protein [Mucilaginibacter sp.]
MKFFRIDLLTLLISLFILNSCKNQDTTGLTLGTKGTLSGSVTDTATVFTNTVLDDSVSTTSITKCPLGYINDPIFGTSSSNLVTDLNLPGSTAYTLPVGTVFIDSARLVLSYADGFYGDSLANYTINVYQLSQRPATGNNYFSNAKWSYNTGNVIGTTTFQPRPLDSIKIYRIIQGAPDTLYKVPPQIRIPINPTFISQYLFNAGSTAVSSNNIFKNNIKGLFITLDPTKTTGVGGTMMIKAPGDSTLAVYIRASNGSVIDTSVVYLDVTQHASQVKHSFSQQVQTALNNKTTSANQVYLEGLSATRVKVSFPYLQKLFTTVGGSGSVVINRAELVVSPVAGSNIPAYLVPLPKLTMYRYDIAHSRIDVEDAYDLANATSVAEFGGYYQLATPHSPAAYHFLVTNYLQDLISNQTIDYGTYIAPVDTTNTTSVDIGPTISVGARTTAVGGYINSAGAANSPYAMKLNVIYTKTK